MHLLDQREFLGEISVWNLRFTLTDFKREEVGFFAHTFSVGFSNLNPKCPDHPLSEKKLAAIFIIFYIFGLWAVTSPTFDKKIMTGLPKFPSTVSEFFEGEKLSHQENFFPSVSDFELMIFGLLFKKIGRPTKTALYVSRGVFWRKKL